METETRWVRLWSETILEARRAGRVAAAVFAEKLRIMFEAESEGSLAARIDRLQDENEVLKIERDEHARNYSDLCRRVHELPGCDPGQVIANAKSAILELTRIRESDLVTRQRVEREIVAQIRSNHLKTPESISEMVEEYICEMIEGSTYTKMSDPNPDEDDSISNRVFLFDSSINKVIIWDAINRYVEACGGDTSDRTAGLGRMNTVIDVERAIVTSHIVADRVLCDTCGRVASCWVNDPDPGESPGPRCADHQNQGTFSRISIRDLLNELSSKSDDLRRALAIVARLREQYEGSDDEDHGEDVSAPEPHIYEPGRYGPWECKVCGLRADHDVHHANLRPEVPLKVLGDDVYAARPITTLDVRGASNPDRFDAAGGSDDDNNDEGPPF